VVDHVASLNVVVPAERVARAVDAVPELSAVLVRSGGRTLSEPWRLAGEGPVVVPPHDPPARAIVVDNQPWAEIAPIVAQVPSIELIQTLTAGVDLLRGVPERFTVANARGAHGPSTAELAMALLLAVRREIPRWVRAQDRREWAPPETMAPTLVGERVLVLGAGDLAVEFAARVRAFGAAVTMVGRTARAGVRGVSELPGLIGGHGVVVVLVSANSTTRHLVDAEFLAAMPDGATLVNAARGWVVDTDALVAELRSGRLTAGLDVVDPEPLPPDHPLWDCPGVLIAPHVGGATTGVADRAIGVAVAQLRQFAAGKLPGNTVHRADLA
jgi:phosphoglycerate dehydrogenase-like enzyme